MDGVMIKIIKRPKLKDPILVEGLPGVGNVGKISAEYLIRKLGAQKFADVFSKYFPPQVLPLGDGTVYLVRNELYYKKLRSKKDLIFLVGDYQGISAEGQYEISYEILKLAKSLGCKFVLTLGGYGVGYFPENPRVFGAATHRELIKKFEDYGVVFSTSEPSGGIVGAAGLLLGLGKEFFGMEGVCIMGETSGYISDPKAALSVVEIVCKYLNIEIDLKELKERSKKMDEITMSITSKIKEEEKRTRELNYYV